MVPRRANIAERRVGRAAQHPVNRRHHRTGCVAGGIKAEVGHHGVGANGALLAGGAGRHAGQPVEHLRRVRTGQLRVAGRAGGLPLQAVEQTVCGQLALNRDQPRRLLGVSVAHVMQCARWVGDVIGAPCAHASPAACGSVYVTRLTPGSAGLRVTVNPIDRLNDSITSLYSSTSPITARTPCAAA